MKNEVETKSLIGMLSSADVRGASQVMVKDNIGALGIYDMTGHELLGIVTERDIVRAVAKGLDPATTSVVAVMTRHPIEAEAPISIEGARDLMLSGHVRHLIVRANGGDHIVSLRDV